MNQAPAYAIGSRRVQADLLLLDTRIGDYIGIVEFKNNINPQIKRNARHQIEQYLKVIKAESLPSYLVYPLDDENFQILVYSENDWVSITHDEFPEFETLSAKKMIEEKAEAAERKQVYYEKKREARRKTSLVTLISLILGLTTAIATFYLSIEKQNENKMLGGFVVLKEIDELDKRIKILESNQKSVNTAIDSIRIVDSSATYVGIDKRLKVIEEGIIDNPEKTIAYLAIKQQLEILRERIASQEKLIALRNESLISRIEWLNAIVSGMVIALFGAAIGFVITNYNGRKNTTAKNG